MPFMVMLAIGVNLPTLEMHLLSYGVEESDVGYWQMIYTTGYIAGSIILSRGYKINKPYIMAFGVLLCAVGCNLLGPNPIMMRNFSVACLGLHFIGWAACMIYSNG